MRKQKSFSHILSHMAKYAMVYVALAVVVIVLILAVRTNMVAVARTYFIDITAPVIRLVSTQKQNVTAMTDDITSLAELKAENERLLSENTKLKQWYQSAIALEAENRSMRQLLNTEDRNQYTVRAMRILSDTTTSFTKTILIDGGKNDAVYKHQPVMNADGLLGRVIEPGKSVSRVLLLSDINSRIPVTIAETNQHAILVGQNNEHPILDYFDSDTKIENDAIVMTSGRGGVLPYGLIIGKVHLAHDGKPRVLLSASPAETMFVKVLEAPLTELGDTP